MSEWYYVENGERVGPVPGKEISDRLKNGTLTGDTLVWREGMPDWVTADTIRAASAPTASATGSNPSTGHSAASQNHSQTSADRNRDQPAHVGVSSQQTAAIYSGFWKRFAAILIDGVILGGIFFVIIIGLALLLGALDSAGASDSVIGTIFVIFYLGYIFVPTILIAWFESSKWQGTPGKLVLGIKVTDLEGNRISFLRAIGRNFAKFISYVILYIGFMMAGWTERKQALHDMIASTLVVDRD